MKWNINNGGKMAKVKSERKNYIIMVSRQMMRKLNITVESDGDQNIDQFRDCYWESLNVKVMQMSSTTKGRILEKAVTVDSPDVNSNPHRFTGWNRTYGRRLERLKDSNGEDLLNNIATAVILATIWDILNAQKRKEE